MYLVFYCMLHVFTRDRTFCTSSVPQLATMLASATLSTWAVALKLEQTMIVTIITIPSHYITLQYVTDPEIANGHTCVSFHVNVKLEACTV